MKDSEEEFLAHHADPREPPVLTDGQSVDGWRVAAFLGRGGSGEVYRVVGERRVEDAPPYQMGGGRARPLDAPQAAALKVLARDTDTARARFLRESTLLAQMDNPAFPRLIAQGEVDGRPYLVMELLEPRALPSADSAVADFLLQLCDGVATLHRMGYVHRDIKPGNILWRRSRGDAPCQTTGGTRSCASASPVLIDLGLVKDVTRNADASGTSLSIVDGHVAGVGTPGYAAPEQLVGDEISPAADIHALGMLANACFDGRPPTAWGRIVDCATGSIPARRYPDVASFARAVRHRHWRRRIALSLAATVLCAAIVLAVIAPRRGVLDAPQPDASLPSSADSAAVREREAWAALCSDVVTNRISQVVVGIEAAVTNETPFNPRLLSVTPLSYQCRAITNVVKVTVVRLEGRTNVFTHAIRLEGGREYRVIGPGVLDVALTGPANRVPRWRSKATAREMRTETDSSTGLKYAISGFSPGEILGEVPSNGVVRLENCVVRNRTDQRWPKNGLYYVLEGRARLELPNLEETLDFRKGDFVATPGPGDGTVLFGEAARRE